MTIMTEDPNWEKFAAVAQSVVTPWSKEKCKLGEFIESLSGDHKDLVLAAVENPSLPTRTLLTALHEVEYSGGRYVVQEHRNRTCACVRGSHLDD